MAEVCCKTLVIRQNKAFTLKVKSSHSVLINKTESVLNIVDRSNTISVVDRSVKLKINKPVATKLLTVCKVGPPGLSSTEVAQINTLIPVAQTVLLQSFPVTSYWAKEFILSVTDGPIQRTHHINVSNSSLGVCYTRFGSVGDIVPHNILIGDSSGNMAISVENLHTNDLKTSLRQVRSSTW